MSHSLWLQERNHKVTGIDISEGAIGVMKKRGVQDVRKVDFFDFKDEKYDTLLLLMNGIGIVQTIDRLPLFFQKAKDLLNDKGFILLDSSNLIYLFLEEDGSAMINLNSDKYIADKYFDSEEFNYQIVLPYGTAELPEISWKGQVDDYYSIELYKVPEDVHMI